jgi:dinuclear metal center YbgI/SA1388 family protein
VEITRNQLEAYLNGLLEPQRFPDYGPNGLQIEGADGISRIAFAVSATAESVAGSIAAGAQALVVHHGLFWKFHGARPLTGPFGRRIFPLIRNGVSLFGYHLPLDAHPEIGNAASLGKLLGLQSREAFGDHQGAPTGIKGVLPEPVAAEALQRRLRQLLDHDVLLASPDVTAAIRSLGIITGGANGDWKLAVQEGLDAYLTGEMSEHDWHDSREAGVHMFAGGHHATERFGIRSLMERVMADLAVDCVFLDSENPA